MHSLFVHEISHVLDLGHSGDGPIIMHPVIDPVWRLAPGDKSGVRTLAKSCPPGVSRPGTG